MALRRRTQRGYRHPPSDTLGANSANPCRTACQPPVVHQSSYFHRALGEDVRTLFPVQPTAQLIVVEGSSAIEISNVKSACVSDLRECSYIRWINARMTSKLETDSVVGPRVRVSLVGLDRLFAVARLYVLRAGLAAVLGIWDLRWRSRNEKSVCVERAKLGTECC